MNLARPPNFGTRTSFFEPSAALHYELKDFSFWHEKHLVQYSGFDKRYGPGI